MTGPLHEGLSIHHWSRTYDVIDVNDPSGEDDDRPEDAYRIVASFERRDDAHEYANEHRREGTAIPFVRREGTALPFVRPPAPHVLDAIEWLNIIARHS